MIGVPNYWIERGKPNRPGVSPCGSARWKDSTTWLRQALAIEASQIVAGKYGVQLGHPAVLKDTNHTIVHLRPSPVPQLPDRDRLFLLNLS
jgi:hypothetical protein